MYLFIRGFGALVSELIVYLIVINNMIQYDWYIISVIEYCLLFGLVKWWLILI